MTYCSQVHCTHMGERPYAYVACGPNFNWQLCNRCSKRLTCLERFDDSENALSRIVYQIGAGMRDVILCLPVAVTALERLQAHMRSPVDGKCPSNRESLSTAGKVACIGFYGRKPTSDAR